MRWIKGGERWGMNGMEWNGKLRARGAKAAETKEQRRETWKKQPSTQKIRLFALTKL
jgi:hypothetical protein